MSPAIDAALGDAAVQPELFAPADPVAGVLDPSAIAPRMSSWDELASTCTSCIACPDLVATRTHVVPGVRPPDADVLVVGEAPGAQEDASGVPFVGKAGKLLTTLLADAGFTTDRIAISNTLKCRPPANRTPHRDELARCRPWLAQQIDLLNPRLILALGGTAAGWFFGKNARIAALRGERQSYNERPVLVSYHPSAAIRFGPNGAPLAALRQDLASAFDLVEELRR